MSFPAINLTKVRTYSVSSRKSKVEIDKLAMVVPGKANLNQFLKSLPKLLKADDFNYLIDRIIRSRQKNKALIFMFGAHVIKCGLSPLLIDLMKRGFVTHLATSGAGAIHDLELAYWGKTSEDVEAGLRSGRFGMSEETAEKFNSSSVLAGREKIGLGEALGLKIMKDKAKYRSHSILASAYQMKIPITVHVALGTDIVHQHANFKPGLTAEASHTDFKILCQSVKSLHRGGVLVNIGSAVVLPEVFLKALSVARNVYGKLDGFTTANFDMLMQYRPLVNVVQRPTARSGRGLNFVGHHEIMIPLLAAGIKAKIQ